MCAGKPVGLRLGHEVPLSSMSVHIRISERSDLRVLLLEAGGRSVNTLRSLYFMTH